MPIHVRCEACGVTLKAPDQLAGQRAKCRCGSVVRVPAASAAMSGGSGVVSGATRTSAAQSAVAAAKSAPPAPRPAAPPPPRMPPASACPNCGSTLPSGAVLCTGCGFNLKTGERMGTATEPIATSEPRRAMPRPARSSAGPLIPIGAIIKLALVGAAVGGGYWFFKSVREYDPVKQGQEMVAKLKPGMTVKQVVDICGKPMSVYTFLDREQQQKYNTNVFEAKIGYADDFMKAHGKEKLRNGFRFVYQFSMAGLHSMQFDGAGAYQSFEELPNLLNR